MRNRLRLFGKAFENIVFAQIKISAINTVLTAIFLLGVLPAFGIHLPYSDTLVILTFFTGLLPVIGNLISNTVITVIAIGVSFKVALAALFFLVAIHKLEYFINAKIVGGKIQAAAWEILLALLVMEACFGVNGLLLAPIVYAYIKAELLQEKLI
jgi:predicted PurR-regulated permease PerM